MAAVSRARSTVSPLMYNTLPFVPRTQTHFPHEYFTGNLLRACDLKPFLVNNAVFSILLR